MICSDVLDIAANHQDVSPIHIVLVTAAKLPGLNHRVVGNFKKWSGIHAGESLINSCAGFKWFVLAKWPVIRDDFPDFSRIPRFSRGSCGRS